jgi:hypothetical protein
MLDLLLLLLLLPAPALLLLQGVLLRLRLGLQEETEHGTERCNITQYTAVEFAGLFKVRLRTWTPG